MYTKEWTVIVPQTAGVVAQVDARKYETIILSIDVPGDNSATVSQLVNGTLVNVVDADGVITLTSASPSVVLEGGPMYSVEKEVTVDPCGVFAIGRRRD